ncbi:hypothetical protein LAZ67_3002662 [Cordylochernes scorpioides]|uniref:DNA helicase n=1 Tax=Cordylochernes scorpioides TaxID=51811 RepID=A0ABY6K8T6_9ARAC|nr:hypothetical protein LAZ67_3002662 [Cordylochernes scorpioides]
MDRQFPLRLAFAMTINKAQVQTFVRVSLLLQESVFTHVQLYASFSRVRTLDNTRVKLNSRIYETRNVVFNELYLNNNHRIVIQRLCSRVLQAQVLTGTKVGHTVLVPKIYLAPSDINLPFILKRCQFPLRLAFAITKNKDQGQTFARVGLLLHEPVFTHGKLYGQLACVLGICDQTLHVVFQIGFLSIRQDGVQWGLDIASVYKKERAKPTPQSFDMLPICDSQYRPFFCKEGNFQISAKIFRDYGIVGSRIDYGLNILSIYDDNNGRQSEDRREELEAIGAVIYIFGDWLQDSKAVSKPRPFSKMLLAALFQYRRFYPPRPGSESCNAYYFPIYCPPIFAKIQLSSFVASTAGKTPPPVYSESSFPQSGQVDEVAGLTHLKTKMVFVDGSLRYTGQLHSLGMEADAEEPGLQIQGHFAEGEHLPKQGSHGSATPNSESSLDPQAAQVARLEAGWSGRGRA